MKKLIFSMALCGLLALVPCLQANTVNIQNEFTVSASATRNITAYEIKKKGHMYITKTVSAIYDSESNTLIVDNESYTVSDNPYYGNSNDKRGDYKYVASGRFYFN